MDKQILDKYRPISLLPIIGKTFEKVLFNSIFKDLSKKGLLSENQCGLIYVSITFFPLPMTYMLPLIATHHIY